MRIAYLENCSVQVNEICVAIFGRLRLEFYNKPRSVLFMHTFKHIESKSCEKVLGIFGYSAEAKVPPDTEKEVSLLKLYFDDEGFIRDVESLTEDQAREIRLEIMRAMPDPEPPPRRDSNTEKWE